MLLPSLFGENLFDEMMNFDFDKELERMTRPLYGKHNKNMMKCSTSRAPSRYTTCTRRSTAGSRKTQPRSSENSSTANFIPAWAA